MVAPLQIRRLATCGFPRRRASQFPIAHHHRQSAGPKPLGRVCSDCDSRIDRLEVGCAPHALRLEDASHDRLSKRMNVRLKVLVAALVFLSPMALASARSCPEARLNARAQPRAATPQELRLFRTFAPGTRRGWRINEWAIAGPWALIGYYNEYAGVTAFFHRDSGGRWILLERGGGQITPDVMLQLDPCMPPKVARALYALAASQDRP